MLSKSQIDRLGERLRQAVTDDDLRLLNEFREEFREAYEEVVQTIRRVAGIEPSGRAAKSVPSIVAKLRRESVRLSQIQDIAGARIVVEHLADQDHVASVIAAAFQQVTVADRRENPSYGYRAVHVIVRVDQKLVEIQVRTALQHAWAQLSEDLSDRFPGLKYGEGDPRFHKLLIDLSEWIEAVEVRAIVSEGESDQEDDELDGPLSDPRKLLAFIALIRNLVLERSEG